MKLVGLLTALLFVGCAQAQTIQQSGNVTPGHVPVWVTTGVLGDGGTAALGSITSLGISGTGGPELCINSAPPAQSNYNQMCFNVSTTGDAQLTLTSFGSATHPGIDFVLNGTTYTFPYTVGGITGPNSSVVGDAICFNNTAGTLASECTPAVGTLLVGQTSGPAQWSKVIVTHPTGSTPPGNAGLSIETQLGAVYDNGNSAAQKVFIGGNSGTGTKEPSPMDGLSVAVNPTTAWTDNGFYSGVRVDSNFPASTISNPIGFSAFLTYDGGSVNSPVGFYTVSAASNGFGGWGGYFEARDFTSAGTTVSGGVGLELNINTHSASSMVGLNIVHQCQSPNCPTAGTGGNQSLGMGLQIGPNQVGWKVHEKILQVDQTITLLWDSTQFTGMDGLWAIYNTPSWTLRKATAGTREGASGDGIPSITQFLDPLVVDNNGNVYLGGDGGSSTAGGAITMYCTSNGGGCAVNKSTSVTSTLTVGGSFAVNGANTKSTDYSMQTSDAAIFFSGAGTITLTLQAASSFPGRIVYLKTTTNQLVNSNSANVVPVAGGSAGTAILAATAGKWAILQSDGTVWQTLAAN